MHWAGQNMIVLIIFFVGVFMDKIISACGNDCSSCPRHVPKTDDELRRTAELWMKIGYRDRIVTNEEISCIGCTKDNWCRYGIVHCTTDRNIENCGQCNEYPCERIRKCFEVTGAFDPSCRAAYSDEEYSVLKKAFFEKQKNLEIIKDISKN